MLEVLIPGIRHGTAVLDTSTAYRGRFVYIKGFSGNEIVVDLPSASAHACKSFYPINKLVFKVEGSDTADAQDKLTKGKRVIYYQGGEYMTDQCSAASFMSTSTWSETSATPHTHLYVGYKAGEYGKLTKTKPTGFAGTSQAFVLKYWGNNVSGKLWFRARDEVLLY